MNSTSPSSATGRRLVLERTCKSFSRKLSTSRAWLTLPNAMRQIIQKNPSACPLSAKSRRRGKQSS